MLRYGRGRGNQAGGHPARERSMGAIGRAAGGELDGLILLDHAELIGNETSVRLALIEPDVVTHDRDYTDRAVSSRRGALPPPDDRDFLKVCVAFTTSAGGRVWVEP